METPPPNAYAKENSLKRYGVDRWGEEFVRVNERGNLVFTAPGAPGVDLHELAASLAARGVRTPFVVRFPTMVRAQMSRLRAAFRSACRENRFPGSHQGVYPLKVNQRRAVVDTVVAGREALGYGLEAGSKPELLLAMAQPVVEGSVLLVNGFKDHEFIRMAFHGAELGHRVIVVLESVSEVLRFVEVAGEQAWARVPELGMRAKLYSRGSGRWQGSGGEASKFGLNTWEILRVLDHLQQAGLSDRMALLHFHIGSQITQIKRIKTAAREAVQLYAGLQLGRCPTLRFLDLGGGIGVDYDGSRTSYPSSVNYSLQEYANQVVFEVGEVIDETGAEAPTILTESGRVVVATHAVTVADLREVQGDPPHVPAPREDEHRLVDALRYTRKNISAKNYEEYFHDAVDFRDEVLKLFAVGVLDIEDRAAAEALFHDIREATARILATVKKPSEEIEEYLDRAQQKYLVNFSIFQSIPDAWSIGQVFPVAPLSRHGDRSETIQTSVVDITCDSDGRVTDFAHPDENLKNLPLHEVQADEAYYLGFFMTGAYQDSLANEHNLFGRCHEVVIRSDDDDLTLPGGERFELDGYSVEVRAGDTNEDVLARMDFDVEHLLHQLRDRHLDVETTLGKPWAMGLLQSYPYLNSAG